MRPIVSFCASPTYQVPIQLTNFLKPLTDQSRHKLQSTDNFIDAIKTVQIPDDHKLVSFKVKSLFTCMPLQLALDCAKTAINNLPLDSEDDFRTGCQKDSNQHTSPIADIINDHGLSYHLYADDIQLSISLNDIQQVKLRVECCVRDFDE